MIRTRTIFFGLAVAASAVSSAQMPPGFKMPSLYYNPMLLMDPAAVADLQLKPEVSTKISTVLQSDLMKLLPVVMGAMQGGKKPDAAAAMKMVKQVLPAFEKMQNEVVAYLTPSQKMRLHQITLQSLGPVGLVDAKTAAQLGLQPRQTAAIGQILQHNQERAKAVMSGGGPNAMQAMTKKQDHSKADAAVDAILTPAQRSKWRAMKGKPIKLGMIGSMFANMFGG